MTLFFWLDQKHELPSRLPGPAGVQYPATVYRMWLTDNFADVLFPAGLSPGSLRELAADERYRLMGSEETLRAFEIRYTPGFRLVAEATPLIDSFKNRVMA